MVLHSLLLITREPIVFTTVAGLVLSVIQLDSILELEGALEILEFGALDLNLNPTSLDKLRFPVCQNEESISSQTHSK